MCKVRKVKYHPQNEKEFDKEIDDLGIKSGNSLTDQDIEDDAASPESQELKKHIADKLKDSPSADTNREFLVLPRFENKKEENDYWKTVGEILGNEKARMILRLLSRDKMILNQLVRAVDGTWSNLKIQIDKMLSVGLINAEEIEIKKRKVLTYTYYSAPSDMVIFFDMTQEYAEDKGILKKILSPETKYKFIGAFTAILGSFIGWDTFRMKYNTGSGDIIPVIEPPFYEQSFFWIMSGIIAFMIFERVLGLIKKKKR
ncbi:MAG: hypothetical protein J4F36_07780 [Nitrosopumilaceae archaeon]|nr:hypothetical protein [Nitrosopumilaceae archaeon]